MCNSRMRRAPIVDSDENFLSLGDLALRQSDAIDSVARKVSTPT